MTQEWLSSIESMLREKQHPISALANTTAVLWEAVPDINWVGFYLMDQGKLTLGPFHGKAACMEIQLGRGVCGAALEADSTLIVPDVHVFPGHIACDAASRSEIVIPVHFMGKAVGVLDVDSTRHDRFGGAERDFLEAVVRCIEACVDFAKTAFDLICHQV